MESTVHDPHSRGDLESKAVATLIGSAIGDALGAPVESLPRGTFAPVTDMVGGGASGQPIGGWTDDTSMALALATSLKDCGGFDPSDVMTRFTDWYQNGAYSHTGACLDIGNTTRTALDGFMRDPSNPWQGITTESSAGNGGIMRVAPVFIRYATDPAQGIAHAIDQSRLTHAHRECDSAVRRLAKYVYAFFDDRCAIDLASLEGVAQGNVFSTGYVVHTLTAAMWAICNTDSFPTAVLHAVNLGHDADTVGAVTGMLAGARYGLEGIPVRWREQLVWTNELHIVGRDLFAAGQATVST